MRTKKETRRAARQLFKASLTASGRLDPEKARQVLRSVSEARPRGHVAILEEYLRMAWADEEAHRAVVESAVALTPDEIGSLTAGIRSRFGADISAEFKTVPALLGGLRIRVASDVWDGSVRGRLDQLQLSL